MRDELICTLLGYELLQWVFNFLRFFREPGQNVHCHKLGGPVMGFRSRKGYFNVIYLICDCILYKAMHILSDKTVIVHKSSNGLAALPGSDYGERIGRTAGSMFVLLVNRSPYTIYPKIRVPNK